MDYVKPEDARSMKGLRVALSVGVFGPWGQAVKKMLAYKDISYTPVAQIAGEPNDELVKWTGTRNAPTIVHDNDPPVIRWFDQINFIEDYKPTPPLLPKDSTARVTVMGICNELAGDRGLGWCRRLMLFDDYAKAKIASGEKNAPSVATMMDQYGYAHGSMDGVADRVVDIMTMIADRLTTQKAKGSAFLVGDGVTVADIYWASFSSMVEPLPEDLCKMPPEMRASRTPSHPKILAAKAPILLEHRNMMFRKHLGPVVF